MHTLWRKYSGIGCILLSIVPYVLFIGGAYLLNHPSPLMFGIPVMMLWMSFCVIATSGIITLIYIFRRSDRSQA